MGCCGKSKSSKAAAAFARARLTGPAAELLARQGAAAGQALRSAVLSAPSFDARALPRPGFDPLRPPPPAASPPPPSGRRFARTNRNTIMYAALDNPWNRARANIPAGTVLETFETKRGRVSRTDIPPVARQLIGYGELDRNAYNYTRVRSLDGVLNGWIPQEDLQPADIEAPGGLPLAPPTGTGQAFLRSAVFSPAFDVRALPRPGFDPLRPPPAPPILAPPSPQPETNVRYVSFSGPGTHVQMWFRLNDPSSRAFAWIRRGSEVEISPRETDVEVRGGRGRPPVDPNAQYTRVVRHIGTDGRIYTGWIRTNELAFQPVGPGGQVLRPVSTGGQYPPWAYAG